MAWSFTGNNEFPEPAWARCLIYHYLNQHWHILLKFRFVTYLQYTEYILSIFYPLKLSVPWKMKSFHECPQLVAGSGKFFNLSFQLTHKFVIYHQCINSFAPGRCGCNIELVIFKFQTHIKNGNIEHFLWNCSQVNVIRPQRCCINVGSGNGLVP